MNRIILIGNGFDLAHGLKTSYKDFMDWYWGEWYNKLTKSSNSFESDALCEFRLFSTTENWKEVMKTHFHHLEYTKGKDLITEVLRKREARTYEESKFMEAIRKSINTKKWVDIEYEFYKLLSYWAKHNSPQKFNTRSDLNEQLKELTGKLVEYLKNIDINQTLLNDGIKEKIYTPIKPQDISINGRTGFISHIDNWVKENIKEWKHRFLQYNIDPFDQSATIDEVERIKSKMSESHFDYFTCKTYPKELLLPDNILLLNFNYTNTANLYLNNKSGFELNHIHGNLDNPDKIIFGYGDEMDDEYPTIEKRNNNELLKNMKTIRYSETDNYRKMLSFIESAPYQIFIMGHSCGNSDRTLLNTLFEHDNCVSIKPYYYKKDDGTDNYIELVQNISRNFTDMKKMRDRVVNKTYCEPLVGEK